ncbi:hypothetical protein LH128_00902 [Sphingomonas sp. LH128]|uniref:hypothetical protein n=1 Tax=Sphingomonas sp. LH128 TaxID=473781 RepID=UPI00027CBF0B|nr:hypothetical protein [Sphingomonas sp. LH128]EJU14983.1 hypothetical protein LH128_00902 [Sphingomonas sp. LH128]
MTFSYLPAGFSDLEPLAEQWALATQNARENRRRSSTPADLQIFYDATVGRLDAMIEYLNAMPLDSMPDDAKNLFYLTLSLAEVAPHIELYGGKTRVPYSFEEERFHAEHGATPFFLG